MKTEIEYWTKDANGHGYCSTSSIEDAIRGHFHDMQCPSDYALGPIVDLVVITKTTTVEVTKESLYKTNLSF